MEGGALAGVTPLPGEALGDAEGDEAMIGGLGAGPGVEQEDVVGPQIDAMPPSGPSGPATASRSATRLTPLPG